MIETLESAGVIVADPPWEYTQYRDSANGAAKASYKCSALDKLAAIPVADWGRKDCVLVLWCTGPKMNEAVALMDAWGFEWKTMIPWTKNSPTTEDLATNVGIWWMGNSEYVAFGTRRNPGNFKRRRGNLGYLHGEKGLDADIWKRVSERVLLAPKDRQHSKKPETLQDYLETFDGPYVELFATREREGWLCLGYDTGYALTENGVEPYAED